MDLLRVKSRSRGISQEAIAVNQVSLDRAWIRVVITGREEYQILLIFRVGPTEFTHRLDTSVRQRGES